MGKRMKIPRIGDEQVLQERTEAIVTAWAADDARKNRDGVNDSVWQAILEQARDDNALEKEQAGHKAWLEIQETNTEAQKAAKERNSKADGVKDARGLAAERREVGGESIDFFEQPDPVDVLELTAKEREQQEKCTWELFITPPLLEPYATELPEPWSYLNFTLQGEGDKDQWAMHAHMF
eukprot:jgi/Tetstr1/446152/TSEL_003555.t1